MRCTEVWGLWVSGRWCGALDSVEEGARQHEVVDSCGRLAACVASRTWGCSSHVSWNPETLITLNPKW